MITYLSGAALAVAPFFFKDGIITTAGLSQEFFLVVSTFLLVCLFGIKKPHLNIKIMGGLVFLIAFFSKNPYGVFQYYQLCLSMAGIAFMAFIYGHKDEIDHKFIFKCMGTICLLESVWVIVQSTGFDPHMFWASLVDGNFKALRHNVVKPFGSLGNQNHSGALVACLLPFIRPVLLPIPLVALFLCDSTMPVLSAVVAGVAYFSFKFRKYYLLYSVLFILAMLSVCLVSGIFKDISFLSDSGRLIMWEKFFEISKVSIFGNGFGWVASEFSKEYINGEKFYQLHNEWFETYAIAGLLGVAVALYLVLPVFKNKDKPTVNACLIALLVNSLGNFTFHIAPLFMVFAYCYALQIGGESEGNHGLERA